MPRPSNCGFHGVHLDKHRGRYKVTVCDPTTGGFKHGGYYLTAEEAAHVYDHMAVELYGTPGAVPRLNFPREVREEAAKKKAAPASDVKAKTADGTTRAAG